MITLTDSKTLLLNKKIKVFFVTEDNYLKHTLHLIWVNKNC